MAMAGRLHKVQRYEVQCPDCAVEVEVEADTWSEARAEILRFGWRHRDTYWHCPGCVRPVEEGSGGE